MSNIDYRPRLTIELREDQYHKLNKLLSHGQRKQLFQVIVDDLIQALEEYGPVVMAALYERTVKLQNFSKVFTQPKETVNEPPAPTASTPPAKRGRSTKPAAKTSAGPRKLQPSSDKTKDRF
jgi:hypothetical protein